MIINLPATYSDITLDQYKRFNASSSDLERISIMADISIEEAKKIPLNELNDLIDIIKLTLEDERAKFFQTIIIDKTEFGFIPNLYSMSIGEYIDLVEFCKDPKKNIVSIMAILYRPITKRVGSKYQIAKYDSNERELNEELIKKVTLDKFNGAMLFFSTLTNDLTKTSLEFLSSEIALMMES